MNEAELSKERRRREWEEGIAKARAALAAVDSEDSRPSLLDAITKETR